MNSCPTRQYSGSAGYTRRPIFSLMKPKGDFMQFHATQFMRKGVIHCRAAVEEVFPLLCPKREEEWIPGWECETILSNSGYNEEGAIFRTTKPYGTELYWTTLQYDLNKKIVDFLLTAPRLYMFRFKIEINAERDGVLVLTFTQVFTSISEEGNTFLNRYRSEDYEARLKSLGEFMNCYLEIKRKKK
jgi:hypothetical protein